MAPDTEARIADALELVSEFREALEECLRHPHVRDDEAAAINADLRRLDDWEADLTYWEGLLDSRESGWTPLGGITRRLSIRGGNAPSEAKIRGAIEALESVSRNVEERHEEISSRPSGGWWTDAHPGDTVTVECRECGTATEALYEETPACDQEADWQCPECEAWLMPCPHCEYPFTSGVAVGETDECPSCKASLRHEASDDDE